MRTINVSREFYSHLVNRDARQGDGQHTAQEFREKFLAELDSREWWENSGEKISIDLEGVETLGPSWANEAFAYFAKYDVSPEKFFEKVLFKNISKVKTAIIITELKAGYNG